MFKTTDLARTLAAIACTLLFSGATLAGALAPAGHLAPAALQLVA